MMIGTPGHIFDLIKQHKDILYSGAGSVLCSLTNTLSASQGAGAMLPADDVDYDASDALRGIPSFTGMDFDASTGMMIAADKAEISIDMDKITIGRPEKGWSGSMRNIDGTDLNFRILDVMEDRTVGVFRMPVEILKAAGLGRRIKRAGEGGV